MNVGKLHMGTSSRRCAVTIAKSIAGKLSYGVDRLQYAWPDDKTLVRGAHGDADLALVLALHDFCAVHDPPRRIKHI